MRPLSIQGYRIGVSYEEIHPKKGAGIGENNMAWNDRRIRMRRLIPLCCMYLSLVVVAAAAGENDFWFSPNSKGVSTPADCGRVERIVGSVLIKRASTSAKSKPEALAMNDRLFAGDELTVPAGGVLEWVCGINIRVLLGGGTRVKIIDRYVLNLPDHHSIDRLDVDLLSGDMRTRCRLNSVNSSAVRIQAKGTAFLVRRGDLVVSVGKSDDAIVLDGEVEVIRGADDKVVIAFGASMNGGNIPIAAIVSLKERLPFNTDIIRAALQPLPPPDFEQDAP